MLLFCSLDCWFVLLGGVACLFIVSLDLLCLIVFVNSVGDCSLCDYICRFLCLYLAFQFVYFVVLLVC